MTLFPVHAGLRITLNVGQSVVKVLSDLAAHPPAIAGFGRTSRTKFVSVK
jgi:hypothetical protein